MNNTAYDKVSKKKRRMENIKRQNAWRSLCPVTRWVDPGRPYSRAKEKQELRALLNC